MVNRIILSILMLPCVLFSGDFSASVSKNQVNTGENFTLNLTLRGVGAKGSPVIDGIKNSFALHSQQQLYNTVMVNGHISSSTTWKYTLTALKEGEILIPKISISTTEGTLSSDPIMVKVTKGMANAEPSEAEDIILTTDISNAKPYKNEPFFYTIKIVSKKDLANIKMQKINIDDAIVETNGEAKVYNKVIDGVSVGVIEFEYLVTPLKAGNLKIPSIVIHGAMPARRKNFSSLFDDDFDPFSMMPGFDRLKPFSLTTEETTFEVLPPLGEVSPWLPAKSLQIVEDWDASQAIKAGEPFTRKFIITAEGVLASQLPSLKDLQGSYSAFKIYADQPELKDETKDGVIKSRRVENYTFIPEHGGTHLLPELALDYWDVVKKEKRTITVPERKVQILPGSNAIQPLVRIPEPEKKIAPQAPTVIVKQDPLLYIAIASLTLLLIIALVCIFMLQRKMKPVASQEEKPITAKPKKREEKLPDLNPT